MSAAHNRRLIVTNNEVARYQRETSWIESEERGRLLECRVQIVLADFDLTVIDGGMRFEHREQPCHWAVVYRDGVTGWVDAERTEVSEGSIFPKRAFEVVVERRIAANAEARKRMAA